MSRIKINLPKNLPFSTVIATRIDDINYGGHLGNDKVLSMVHEARMRFLKHHGYTELDLEGVSIIMADAGIVYKSEGFHFNEIEVHVGVGDFSASGFDIYYKMFNKSTGKDLAYAKTGIVCFDYKERKVQRVPDAFKRKILGN